MGAPTPLARRRSGGITHQPAGLSITIFAAVAPSGRQPQRISIAIPRAREEWVGAYPTSSSL